MIHVHAWRPYSSNRRVNMLYYLLFENQQGKDDIVACVNNQLRVKQRMRLRVTTNVGMPMLVRGRFVSAGSSGPREMMLCVMPW